MREFGQLLDQNSSLATYVHELEISNGNDHEPNNTQMGAVLDRLTQVTSFTFGYCEDFRLRIDSNAQRRPWAPVEDSLLLFMQRNAIVSLSLFNIVEFPLSVLQLMNSLENLTVLNVSPEKPRFTARPIRLKELVLRNKPKDFIERAILSSNLFEISHLTHLSIFMDWEDPVSILHSLLVLPKSLESLSLSAECESLKAYRFDVVSL